MPRPPRRAAPRRGAAAAATAAAATAPDVPAQPVATSSETHKNNDHETELPPQRRRSGRISSAPMSAGKALQDSRKRRDSAMDRLENMTSTDIVTTNDEGDTLNLQLDRSDESLELSRREGPGAATPLQGRLADLSGLDLDDSMFNDLNTTFNTEPPASAGPGSHSRLKDSSTITASHFKRRPRAGSFLSRDDGPIRPSSRAGPNTPGLSSTFNIGNFRRRAREPSILGTAQKPRAQAPSRGGVESDLDTRLDDEDDDDSEPEAESTPFKATKRQSGNALAQDPSSQPRASRKRKSTEGHQQRQRSSPQITRDEPTTLSDSDADDEEQPTLPPMPTTSRARGATPDRPDVPAVPSTPVMDEELMAPPLSSDSSEEEGNIWPPIQTKGRARRPALRRTPNRDDNLSDLSSPPSLTHSPNYANDSSPAPVGRAAKRKAPPTKAQPERRMPTTAALTGLLPRRRVRNTRADESDEEAVDISGLGNGNDELSHMDVRSKRRPTRAAARNQLNATAASNRQKAAGKQPAVGTRRSTRTYGRLSSDKENEAADEEHEQAEEETTEQPVGEASEFVADGDETTLSREDSQIMVERMGEELKQAARKFQEVDKWSLEYEERVLSSSPGR